MTTIINPQQAYLDQTEITQFWIERLLNRKLDCEEARETYRYLARMYQVGYADGRLKVDCVDEQDQIHACLNEMHRREKQAEAGDE